MWAPQRKVVARRWPAVAALRCNTMRCDAMLCRERRCAESSRATRATGTKQKQKPRGLCGRMKRSSDQGMIGRLVRWWKSDG
jgi:hypothetical protein